ncbi:MAG: UDP-N-acetylglucosamine 2-epimerase [Planctomycetes bacterium RBG_16_64_10]|nr:MAG: UDP-N-acetylglucosamine 2-epimerase [Planctomycetes bacterium RBG_16_64_10]
MASNRLKVMTIVGTRPEVIKLSRVLAELESHTNHVLVHTGQNYDYELNEVFFRELQIKPPDHYLAAVGKTTAESIGLIIARSDEVIAREDPEAVLLYGDTNSCLAVIAAKRRRVPVFHMEAGNRCFDQRVPEEINRKIVDHTADINLPLTEHARRYLLSEGLRPETVIKTGSPMYEVLSHYRASIDSSDVLRRLDLQPHDYFVVSAHREENVECELHLQQLLAALSALADRYGKPIVFSVHPRTRARLRGHSLQHPIDTRIRLCKPFGFFDYNKLQGAAFCVLSDSGTLTEEAAILGFPAITIREAHERPEGMDQGVLIMSGLRTERILQAVDIMTAQHQRGAPPGGMVPDYCAAQVSKQVVRVLMSYTDYVNRTVWARSA